MAVGYAVERILTAGTTNALCSAVYDGELPQQVTYPAIAIDDFSESEECKDGEGQEYFTVTINIYGQYKSDLEAIVEKVKTDLIGYRGKSGGVLINGVKYEGRLPWFKDKETQIWARPIEFQIIKKEIT